MAIDWSWEAGPAGRYAAAYGRAVSLRRGTLRGLAPGTRPWPRAPCESASGSSRPCFGRVADLGLCRRQLLYARQPERFPCDR